jgi:protein-tyrosine phosphatase
MADSLELARAAVAEGTGTVVATPHVRSDFFTEPLALPELVHEVQERIDAEGLQLAVRCGGELGHDMVGRLRQRELDAIAQGPPGGRWLLVEAPFERFSFEFHLATAELRDRGYAVVVAHPERSADAELDGCMGLRRELRFGSLAQLNAVSLTGRHGPEAERAAFDMAREGLATVVGSDAHGPTRPPALRAARRALLEHGMTRVAGESLVGSGPRGLLARGIAGSAAAA